MQNPIHEVIAENIWLRLMIARPRPDARADGGPVRLEALLPTELAPFRHAIAEGGLPAAAAVCAEQAPCAAEFPVAAYKAYLAAVAWQCSALDPHAKAVTHLVADTILARAFVRFELRCQQDGGSECARLSKFITVLRERKLDVVARLDSLMAGDCREDPLAPFRPDIEPRLAIYAEALLGRPRRPNASAAFRRYWGHTIVGGGLEARRIRRYEFGTPSRLLATPLVLADAMNGTAEVKLHLHSLAKAEVGPARAFIAIGARDQRGRFADLTWATQDDTAGLTTEGPLICGEVVVHPAWTACFHLAALEPAVEVFCCLVPLGSDHRIRVWSQFRDCDPSWIEEVPPEVRSWLAPLIALAQQAANKAANAVAESTRRQVVHSTGSRQLGWPQPVSSSDCSAHTGMDERANAALILEAVAFVDQDNVDAAIKHVIAQAPEPDGLSHLLMKVAEAVADARPDEALRLYWLAYGVCPSSRRGLRIAAKMFTAGNITSAAVLSCHDGPATTHLRGELRLAAELYHKGPRIPPMGPGRPTGQVERAAYVASSAQPFQITGYTVRTHQLLSALNAAGTPTTCFIRPGYPHDRARLIQAWPENTRNAQEFTYTIGAVPYQTSWVPGIDHDPEDFMGRMADRLVEQFEAFQPTVVQAASNYRNALPALIAARRLGIPFIYEVRGLWELTTASRKSGWETTERFRFDREMELRLASEADRVLTITHALAAELVQGGVPEDRIAVLPNAVDPDHFRPVPRDEGLARALGLHETFTLVYAGSLTVYEGLDDLIEAVGILRQEGLPASLIIIGEGVVRPSLQQLVQDKGLQRFIQFLGRIKPDEILSYLSLADAVALPRKAYRVCKIVSPLKPFEAMAMAKPVILTDLPVLREIVQDGHTGLICNPEDPRDLARTLRHLAENPMLCRRLGEAARRWVVEERSWSVNAAVLQEIYARLIS
jgi:glycosyltransferase involved in cell wall biosynthesis